MARFEDASMGPPALEYGTHRPMSRPALYGFIASLLLLLVPFVAAAFLEILPESAMDTWKRQTEWSIVFPPIVCMLFCLGSLGFLDSSRYRGKGFAIAGTMISAFFAALYLLWVVVAPLGS